MITMSQEHHQDSLFTAQTTLPTTIQVTGASPRGTNARAGDVCAQALANLRLQAPLRSTAVPARFKETRRETSLLASCQFEAINYFQESFLTTLLSEKDVERQRQSERVAPGQQHGDGGSARGRHYVDGGLRRDR